MTSSHHANISMVTRSTQYINQQITHTHRAWCEQSVGCTAACSSERSWLAGTGVSAPWWQNINSQHKATMSTIWRRSKVINKKKKWNLSNEKVIQKNWLCSGLTKERKMSGNFLIKTGKTKVITYWNIFIEINSILSYQKRFFNL